MEIDENWLIAVMLSAFVQHMTCVAVAKIPEDRLSGAASLALLFRATRFTSVCAASLLLLKFVTLPGEWDKYVIDGTLATISIFFAVSALVVLMHLFQLLFSNLAPK